MNRKGGAQKYYAHIFRQSLYQGQLTAAAKNMIADEIRRYFTSGRTLISAQDRQRFIGSILQKYGRDEKGEEIFPDQIRSYVYQTMTRQNVVVQTKEQRLQNDETMQLIQQINQICMAEPPDSEIPPRLAPEEAKAATFTEIKSKGAKQ